MELKYKGLIKLAEECGELVQVTQKMVQFFDKPHPTKKDLRGDLHEEIADVLATIEYVVQQQELDRDFLEYRKQLKLDRFISYIGKTEV